MKTQIVWFKRDLRWTDHAPLVHAAKRGKLIALWVYEPEQWIQADAAAQHLCFANECLRELEYWCASTGGRLLRMHGHVTQVLSQLHAALGEFELSSYEETGNAWSYARDRAVTRWCREHAVAWHEFPSNAVVRRLKSRNQWTALWNQRMSSPPLDAPNVAPNTVSWAAIPNGITCVPEMSAKELGMRDADKPARVLGGRSVAMDLLHSFLMERGQYYRGEMSSPVTATTACSRLSPHLAWGSISIRECIYAVMARREALYALPRSEQPAGFLASIKSFEGRLHWHCHFIQKLEDEPPIEFQNVHRGYDGLRNEATTIDQLNPDEAALYQAWCTGRTGFPFVDACMRSLAATGWINFRMRAMLMSFASYNLWLHWRLTGLHLAREFTDYEPGIHWSQAQMQSGVTGINAIRIYNVVKQSVDQDPEGVFIRQWVPELAHLSNEHIHTPWVAGIDEAIYPEPIVDVLTSMRAAKEKIYTLKRSQDVRSEAQKVYDKHGSRSPARERKRPTKTAKPKTATQTQQISLFDT